MAPVADASYFPPLDRCLAGESRLISWRTAYRALCDEDSALANTNLEQFLSDNDTIALLSKALSPFPGPSQKSTQELDTRTAPINVSQNSNGHYKLDEIKADTKWLSLEVEIDEMVALRMAVIEWQERAADQLLNTALNPPSSASGSVALSSSVLGKSSFNFTASTHGQAARRALDFTSEEVRRRRLVDVYLSEKAHLLKLRADLVTRSAVGKSDIQGQHVGSLREHSSRNWIDDLATKVFDTLCSSRQRIEHENFCVNNIESIALLLDAVRDAKKWPKRFQDNPEEAQVYLSSLYTELVAVLRLLLANLYALDGIPSPTLIRRWFSVMYSYDYLNELPTLFAECDAAQLLVSVISLEILKLQLVIAEIEKAAGVEMSGTKSMEGSFYIKNNDCMSFLTSSFHRAATSELICAAPAIYAWSIITLAIGDVAGRHRVARENRIEQAEKASNGTADDQRMRDFRSEFENLYNDAIIVREWESTNSTTSHVFLRAAVDDMNVNYLITILSNSANGLFGSDIESATGFMCKEALLDLLREGLDYVQYDTPVLNAILSILTPAEFHSTSKKQSRILAGKMYYDEGLFRTHLLDQALKRYPYELSPLLRLSTALASVEDINESSDGMPQIVAQLDSMPFYTQIVHTLFSDYALLRPELGNNEIELTVDVPMFAQRGQSFFRTTSQRALPSTTSDISSGERWRDLFVPAGSKGRIIKHSKPYILSLQHEHSGLEYLGLLLSTFTPSGDIKQAAPDVVLDRPTAAEIIALFTSLISAMLDQSSSSDNAANLLACLSAALRNEQDIVTVVSDVLESELQAHLDQNVHEGSLDVVLACIQFLDQLVKIFPERVWSILVRSSLLGVQDGAVSLASVVGGAEIPVGRYHFLNACTQLHTSLLDDALFGSVKRKAVAARSNHRFAQEDDSLDATPDRTMSAVLNSFQKILLDVLQNLPNWKFQIRQERCNITINILDAFSKLLKCTYGVDVAKDPSKRLTNVLAPAAEALLDVCSPQSGSSPVVSTFNSLLPEGLPIAEDTLLIHIRGLLMEQVKSSFRFITLLMRTTKAGIDLSVKGMKELSEEKIKAASRRTRNLATDLVKQFPTLASLLVSDHSLKADLFPLLSELVEAIGSGDEDPPSILAQLEPKAQEALLSVTTQLDRPLCDVQVERRVWDFLSTVMASKQNYLAAFLLTGQLPRKRVNPRESDNGRGKSILTYVLDQLSAISILPPERANGMLKFITTAQQVWVWANTEIRSHPDFLKNTLAWIDTLWAAPRDPSPGASIISAKECEMASYLCNIYAISIHAGLETGDKTVLKGLIPKLKFLREHGVAVNAYNRSLHRNLTENLKRKFPHADLSDFKRTAVNPGTYGAEFFYDRGFATSVLCHDVSWHGGNKGRNQGFSDEFSRANANLSLLDAQMKLLTSWKTLAITICDLADQESSVQTVLAQVAEKCLLANAEPQLDQPGAADVLNTRIELAFVLCSKLVALNVQDETTQSLLIAAWELVRLSPVDFDIATASEDVQYYRQLLQVLYLTIQPHGFVEKAQQGRATDEGRLLYLAPEIGSVLVSIVGRVIAPGFRALCANIHTNLDLALPADFALLTALLQSVISTPGISSVYTLLSDIVADSALVRSALSLYSWSDQLAEATAHDPVYGEVAVMFLLALSTVPPVAEQMALAGVLTQLSASNLSNYFRKAGGKGPFDEPQRMFVIWSEGFLPICLNLIDAVGPPVAAEVGAFLNSFPEQLRRAERALRNETPSARNPRAGAVTLGLVAEANSLAMLSVILESDAARSAAEGINGADIPAMEYDVGQVKALMEALSRKRNLSERLTPMNALEEKWAGKLGGSDDMLLLKALKEVASMLACVGSSDPSMG